MRALSAVSVILLLLVGYCHGSCYVVANEPDSTVCKTRNGTLVQPGESIRIEQDCTDCTCHGNMLSCCGYGFYAGPIMVVGCKVVVDDDGCSAKVVDIIDETKPCTHRG